MLAALTIGLVALGAAGDAKPVAGWAALVDAASRDPKLAQSRDAVVTGARRTVALPIVKRVYRYEEIGKERTWLDGRAVPMQGQPRQVPFALAMSDFGTSGTILSELPQLAVAYRFTGDEVFRTRILAQLEECASWSPLQRPGWSLCVPAPDPVPPGFSDGNWLATGQGVRALADALELMPAGSIPPALLEKLHALLEKEIAGVVDDWQTKRAWFIRSNYPRSNQWVLPTEGLVRACLVLGREKHAEAYELGVRNLLAALDAQGAQGEFYEGIGYANFTLESMLHAAHAMAAAGDRRALDHPFLRRFPTWMVHHLQPGRYRVNCFDAGGAKVPPTDGGFRGLLSLFLLLTGDPVAWWALEQQFAGPPDTMAGMLARATAGESREPPLFAAYESATRVNWRDSWADDASGVWVRGGHRLDSHDHHDRGHVNLIVKGRPLLIEAGTPSYDNPRIHTHYSTAVGHNVLEVEGHPAKKAPAPVAVQRLDATGGDVTVDPTACYPGLKQWQRRVTWTRDALDVEDAVAFAEGQSRVLTFRWHLGTDAPAIVTEAGGKVTVEWPDGRLLLESDAPVTVTTESLPDNTVTLGKKAGPDFLHTCVVVRTVHPCAAWRLKTHASAR